MYYSSIHSYFLLRCAEYANIRFFCHIATFTIKNFKKSRQLLMFEKKYLFLQPHIFFRLSFMKKIILLIVTLLYSFGMLVAQQQRYDFTHTCADGQKLYMKITDESNSTATVVSQYDGSKRYERPLSGHVEIPAVVVFNGQQYIVEAIGDKAFMGCRDLSVVVIPSGVKRIGIYAFSNCSGLTTLQMPTTLESIGASAFAGCIRLAGPLVLPSKIRHIGSYAFAGCSSLTSIELPESLEDIGSCAFKGCAGLRGSITITPKLKSIGSHAFADCSHLSAIRFYGNNDLHMGNQSAPVFAGCVGITSVTIGDNVTVIPENAFKGCTALKEANMPQGLTSIGHSAFSMCSNLEGDLIIPAKVSSIGGSAFNGCSSLRSLQLPEGITEIGDYTFFQCNRLEGRLILPDSVTHIGTAAFKGCGDLDGPLVLPAGVTYIGSEAFMGCEHLTGTLTIPIGVKFIGNSAFADCRRLQAIEYGAEDCHSLGTIGHTAFHGCTGIKSLTIFHGVKQIPNCAFSNCTGIEGDIKIPDGVAIIGSSAFSGCTQITSVEIPHGVEKILTAAFRGCTRLDGTLTLPSSLESIGSNAFENCINITAIQMEGYPPRVGHNAFYGINSLIPVYVPCMSLPSYQNHEEWRYFSHIEGVNSEHHLAVRSTNDDRGSVRIIKSNTCSYAQAMIQAIAKEGYVFVEWADGIRDNPRTLLVTSDTLMEAFFEEGSMLTITGLSNNDSLGTVLGGGDFEKGDEITLMAIAFAGTIFDGWSDGNRDNPRTFVAQDNGRYLALFSSPNNQETTTTIENRESSDDLLYPIENKNGSILIRGTKGHTVIIYDEYGRIVEKKDNCPKTFLYTPKSPGNYLVRIDTGEIRRVVIAD